MFSLSDRIPKYLLGKYQLMTTVLFTALFSLVCILLVSRFFLNSWFSLDSAFSSGYMLGFYALSIGLLCISRRLMYVNRDEPITYMGYILWLVTEVVAVALLYTGLSVAAPALGLPESSVPARMLFARSLMGAAVAMGVPYILVAQYFAIEDKNNTMRVMNYSSVVTDMPLTPQDEKRITLYDNAGVIKLSLTQDKLYYVESDDNYVKVWYTDASGAMKQYMLRCRLKTIEESFVDSDLVRCHRKFLVNIHKVEVLLSEKEGYYLILDSPQADRIPVSKTYEEFVLTKFNSR